MTVTNRQRDDVNEEASTGEAVVHQLRGHGPRKFITIAVDCEDAVVFAIDFSTDQGATYPTANRLLIEMDSAGSDIRNIVNQRPNLTHIKITPDRAGTYTIRSILSDIATETSANIMLGGLAVDSSNPVPHEQYLGGAAVSEANPMPVKEYFTKDEPEVSHNAVSASSSIEVDCRGKKQIIIYHTMTGATTGGYATVKPKTGHEGTALACPWATGDSANGLNVKAADVNADYISVFSCPHGLPDYVDIYLHRTDGAHTISYQLS